MGERKKKGVLETKWSWSSKTNCLKIHFYSYQYSDSNVMWFHVKMQFNPLIKEPTKINYDKVLFNGEKEREREILFKYFKN